MTFTKRFTDWRFYAKYALQAILITTYYLWIGNFQKTPMQMGIELAGLLIISDNIVKYLFWNAPASVSGIKIRVRE